MNTKTDLLKKVVSSIHDALQHRIGNPVALQRVLTTGTSVSWPLSLRGAPSIAAEEVVGWHQWPGWTWHHPNEIRLYAQSAHGFQCSYTRVPCLAELVTHEIDEEWTCDISEVTGLSASKSRLSDFASLDDMALAKCRDLIDDVSPSSLDRSLRHDEIRILHRTGPSDHFCRFTWDGDRIYLMNSGGSHHFAAGRYLAGRLQQPVPLNGALHTYSLNPAAIKALIDEYVVLSTPDTFERRELWAAMKAFEVSYGLYPLPRPYHAGQMLLLPRREARSVTVARTLLEAGACDLAQYFDGVIRRQTRLGL